MSVDRRRALLGFGLLSSAALLALLPSPTRETPAPDPSSSRVSANPSPDADVRFLPVSVTASGARPVHHEAYLADRVMIRPHHVQDADQIAADYGGTLFRRAGRSGWVGISVPTGTHIGGAVETLRRDPRIARAGPVGIVRGATTKASIQSQARSAMKVSSTSVSSSVRVAVVDTGVAYENYTDDGVTYVRASTLSGTTFVAPYDFVNDDSHANDDHMHGTHIASIIASKPQYSGDIRGVAPGVSIIPIKVLDETNSGNELDLIDGIKHAIDNDADVINLSLAFDETYVPSAALQEVLAEAHAANIIVVAAAGNEASDQLAWPAASPYVLAVAAACPDTGVAPYSNTSPGVHVTGVGGCMDVDADKDGYPDGMLGQTIGEGDPSTTQYVLWAGTSQAAATVSGTAALYLDSDDDADADLVPSALQDVARTVTGGGRDEGTGAGLPNHAIDDDTVEDAPETESYLIAVLPYLHRTSTTSATPAAIVHVITSSGSRAPGGNVWLTMKGSTTASVRCKVASGKCHFKASDAVALVDADGDERPLGWSFQVDAYEVAGINQIMQPAMFVSDGLEVLVAAMDDNCDTAGLPLGIYWPENESPYPSVTTSESYAFVDSGVGFASSPLAVLLTPANFPASALSTETVDLDGVGFSSSPLGTMNLTVIEFGGVGFSSSPLGGVGFSSSPLGLSTFSIAVMDGVGFSSSPLGLDAFDIYTPDSAGINLSGVGFSSSPLGGVGFASSPLNLATGTIGGKPPEDSHVSDLLDDGGWTLADGDFALGTGLIGSSMVDTTPTAVGAGGSDGWEECE